MYTSWGAIGFGLAVLTTTASAVQLASFTPRVEITQPNCQAAYTTNISGCTPNDFSPSAICSSACVQGLVKIGEVVKRVCRDVDVGETSIIGVFQNDLGLAALCPGASVSSSTSAASSTRAASPQSSAQAPASRASSTGRAASTSASAATSTSAAASPSQSEATASSSTSSRALIYDPSPSSVAVAPTSTVQPPAQSSTPAARPAPGNAQLSNADSGGGSPFDVQAGSASSLSIDFVAFLGASMLLVAFA